MTASLRKKIVKVEAMHVDGTMSASERDSKLSWLKDKSAENECRILTNVRCLSEGVDVPSLDAVIFLAGMGSEIDVAQAVGRVMRMAKGKKEGYIIIPVVIPDFVDIDQALYNSDTFGTVWKVIRALKAHDDRLDATINKIGLNRRKPQNIMVAGPVPDADSENVSKRITEQMHLQFTNASGKIYARLVEKLGTKAHWRIWAERVADIAANHSKRIKELVALDREHEEAFDEFLEGLRRNINPNVSKDEAVDMLAQHIIIKPIFEALFEGDEFSKKNPISLSMQKVLDLLEKNYEERDQGLLKYHEYVKERPTASQPLCF